MKNSPKAHSKLFFDYETGILMDLFLFACYNEIVNVIIEFNPAAFKHNVNEADIRRAFDTSIYDGWFNEGKGRDKDKYLLIGFDKAGNPLEVLYNQIDDKTINVFHAMKCRDIFHHLLKKEG